MPAHVERHHVGEIGQSLRQQPVLDAITAHEQARHHQDDLTMPDPALGVPQRYAVGCAKAARLLDGANHLYDDKNAPDNRPRPCTPGPSAECKEPV